jgi:5-methylcytosine-specific restriction protein A
MPRRAPRVCPHCKRLITGNRCVCRPAWHGSTSPPSTRRWRKLRSQKLDANPRCEWPDCGRPAVTVDHIKTLAEDLEGRYVWDNLQSLCQPHHDEKTAADALRGKVRPR